MRSLRMSRGSRAQDTQLRWLSCSLRWKVVPRQARPENHVAHPPTRMHSGMNDKYRVLGWIIAYAIITYVERTACARHAATLALLLAAMEGGTSPSASRKPRRLIATYSTSFGDVVGLGGPRAASYLFEHVFAYRWNACCPSEAEK